MVYRTQIISTIVDKADKPMFTGVYRTQIISTIVDEIRVVELPQPVYRTQIISTIVDNPYLRA